MTVEIHSCSTPRPWVAGEARSGGWSARLMRCASYEAHAVAVPPSEAWKRSRGWVSALGDMIGPTRGRIGRGHLRGACVMGEFREADADEGANMTVP